MKRKKWKKHIVKEGSREHVTCWDSYGRHCKEPDCELNKPIVVKVARLKK